MNTTTVSIDNLSKTCIQLLMKEPFYGHYLTGLPKEVTTKVDTAAVSLENKQLIKLMVSPEFWLTLTPETRYGLIKHEVLHIVFKHLLLIHQYSNKRLFNIAADIVVNQYISPEQLPNGGITIDQFLPIAQKMHLAFAPNMDVGYYYDQLLKLSQQLPNTKSPAQSDDQQMVTNILNGGHPDLQRHQFWNKFQELSASEMKILEQLVKSMFESIYQQV